MGAKKMYGFRFLVAAVVLMGGLAGHSAVASIVSFRVGKVHNAPANSLDGTVELSNCSVLDVSPGNNGGYWDNLVIGAGSIIVSRWQPPVITPDAPTDPVPQSVPEPTAIVIWSFQGGLGIAVSCSRRQRAACPRVA